MKVDQVKLAEILKVNKKTISRAIQRGRLEKSVTKLSNGRFEIDLVPAVLEWYARKSLSQDRGQKKDWVIDELMEIQKSRQIKEHYNALLEEISYRKEKGEYIPTKVANKEVYDLARDTRERLFNIPDALSHTLAVEKEPSRVRRILTEELEKALTELGKNVFN